MTSVSIRRVIILLLVLFLVTSFLLQIFFRYSLPRKYQPIVERYATEYGLPQELLYAVIKTESNFSPGAVSSAGAVGLMQIMPSTFLWLAEMTGETLSPESLTDPDINIRYGAFFLRYLYDYYGKYETALAAYNAGMGNVSAWLASEQYSDGGVLVVIPFRETSEYVRLVTKRTEQYKKLYN